MIPLRVIDVLNAVTIPVACSVPWDAMHGDDRTRFCDKCQQNVYDVSERTRAEVVQLLTGSSDLPCLRIYQRPDGRVMTADCATKRERVWKWLKRHSAWAAALFALVVFATREYSKPMMGAVCRPHTPELVVEEAAQSIAEGVAAEAARQNDAVTKR